MLIQEKGRAIHNLKLLKIYSVFFKMNLFITPNGPDHPFKL